MTQTQTKEISAIDAVRGTLLSPQMGAQFQAALPKHIDVAKFQRVAATAVANNPDLLTADRATLFGACMKSAQDGLLPDGREAALVIFKAKEGDRWVKKVQYMPMIAGVLKKVRNSGELKELSAHAVYLNDSFEYWIDDTGEHLNHRPLLEGDRGAFRLVYAIATTSDGGRYIEVMTKDQVERVRSISKAKDHNGNPTGPWLLWYDEMARKTVIRRLSKRLPMSTDLDEFLRRDDELYDVNATPAAQATPTGPAIEPKKTRPRRLQNVIEADAGKTPDAPPAKQESEHHPQETAPGSSGEDDRGDVL